ncbi:MAG: DnaJ domain-containing protein [Pyrinomonadaceae bacterium]
MTTEVHDEPKSEIEANGKLARFVAMELCASIANSALSGSLRLEHEKEKVVIYFSKGSVVFAISNARIHRLFEILISEEVVSKEKIVEIEGFTNDLHLAKKLVELNEITQFAANAVFTSQISLILLSVWKWESGIWSFSPLSRIKDGINFPVTLAPLFDSVVSTFTTEDFISRFKTLSEQFVLLVPENKAIELCTTPEEAFLISRIGEGAHSIDALRDLLGVQRELLLVTLYKLWLRGVLERRNWASYLPLEIKQRITSSTFSLKQGATSYEEKLLREEEERQAEFQREEEEKQKAEAKAHPQQEMTLDEYLARVERAATYYELFGIETSAETATIKKIYFSFAKNFHPDLFHRKVDSEFEAKIQDAFTQIARAYETLKDKDARELYDFKMRKVLESAQPKADLDAISSITRDDHDKSLRAEHEFNEGYSFFSRGNYNDARPHFERAVMFNGEEAKYHAYLGIVLSKNSESKHRAETELRTACTLDETNADYRIMLAEAYIHFGITARAKGELQRLLAKAPNNSKARTLLDSLS